MVLYLVYLFFWLYHFIVHLLFFNLYLFIVLHLFLAYPT